MGAERKGFGIYDDQYLRRDGANFMEGPLTLNGDPATDAHAGSKSYIDAQRDAAIAEAQRLVTQLQTILENGLLDPRYLNIVWEDLRTPGHSLDKGAAVPDLGAFLGAGNLMVRRFDGGVLTEQLYLQTQLQHAYAQGTSIHPHIHWTPTDGNAGNVKWQMEYSWANIGDVFPPVTTIEAVEAASGNAWQHQVAYFPFIIIPSGLSSMLPCRIFRDPTDGDDTYNSDAAFLEFDAHVRLDARGSVEELVK